MDRHLHLVPAGADLVDEPPVESVDATTRDRTVVDLDSERQKRRSRYHPAAGKAASVANPIRMSLTPVQYDRAPPLLGQHTEEVLSRLLGIDAQELSRLKEDAVIG